MLLLKSTIGFMILRINIKYYICNLFQRQNKEFKPVNVYNKRIKV